MLSINIVMFLFRESISRVSEAAGLKTNAKKNKKVSDV